MLSVFLQLMDPERESVERFLKSLQATPGGSVIAANMIDSHLEGLVSVKRLRDFLLECAEAHRAEPSVSPTIVVEDVARGWGPRGTSYIREFRQTEYLRGERFSTVMKTDTFWQFLLDDSYKDPNLGAPVVLPPFPTNSPSGLREYEARLRRIVASNSWIAPDASLGRPLPEPANCWISTDRFTPDPDSPVYPDDSGTRSRDELGLVGCRHGSFLVRFSFPAHAVADQGAEMARPSFADLGNPRFAVRQMSHRARTYAASGWGATVHLGKFVNGTPDITGASERVTRSLHAASLGLHAEFLGIVKGDHGDDDEAFSDRFQQGRTTSDVRVALMSLLK